MWTRETWLRRARPAERIVGDSTRKSSRRLRGAQLLKFLRGLWPILFEQQRERAIRQELAARLAVRTIIRLVVGVTDALDLSTAFRARLAEFSMHCHLRAKRSHVSGKPVASFLPQNFDPVRQ